MKYSRRSSSGCYGSAGSSSGGSSGNNVVVPLLSQLLRVVSWGTCDPGDVLSGAGVSFGRGSAVRGSSGPHDSDAAGALRARGTIHGGRGSRQSGALDLALPPRARLT